MKEKVEWKGRVSGRRGYIGEVHHARQNACMLDGQLLVVSLSTEHCSYVTGRHTGMCE